MRTRFPTVAGSFYPSDPNGLRREIEACFKHRMGPGEVPRVNEDGARRISAIVCPHAGYMYSGPVASHGYGALAEDGAPEIFILLGPNHTGFGSGVSIMLEGNWRTPLGDVQIDRETAVAVADCCRIIDADESAHRHEHSIEVQLPFLQYLYGSAKIVPICFLMQDLETAWEVGEAIARTIAERNAVIIASTDLTHYEPHAQAAAKDRRVIDAVLSLDAPGVADVIERLGVSMCGPGPVMAAIAAARVLRADKGELLAYATSGDITGDRSSVVGYASIALKRA